MFNYKICSLVPCWIERKNNNPIMTQDASQLERKPFEISDEKHLNMLFPFKACPKCGPGRICHIHQGNLGNINSSTCECLPGSVEKDGECVWCHGE